MTHSRIDFSTYIVLSIWFGCNNNCTICMLSNIKKSLVPIGFEKFKSVLTDIKSKKRFKNLILSGAEVTTFQDLDKYIRFAASLDWFEKIQIQTNGRMLKDKRYLQHLVKNGVNEFFISLHGLENAHDAVTRVQGAFADTMTGLDLLEDMDVNVLTNTVLTTKNIDDVPDLFYSLARRGISEIHLWNYYPMERTDRKGFIVKISRFRALLPGLVELAGQSGKSLVLKSFPECLPIEPPGFLDSLYPETVLPSRFWKEFGECGFGTCVHREPCENWRCWGLSQAYIQKYGDESLLLSPMRHFSRAAY